MWSYSFKSKKNIFMESSLMYGWNKVCWMGKSETKFFITSCVFILIHHCFHYQLSMNFNNWFSRSNVQNNLYEHDTSFTFICFIKNSYKRSLHVWKLYLYFLKSWSLILNIRKRKKILNLERKISHSIPNLVGFSVTSICTSSFSQKGIILLFIPNLLSFSHSKP